MDFNKHWTAHSRLQPWIYRYRDKKHNSLRSDRRFPFTPRAEVNLAAGLDVINDLGLDTLTFLAATVFVVPTFKAIKASPVC